MNAEEKTSLYHILKMLSAWQSGYPSAHFDAEPSFKDDLAEPTRPPIQGEAPAQIRQTGEQAPFSSINDVSAAIARCTKCGLCHTRRNTVPGEGVLNPIVLVVGEGPGADEDASGRPFVGRAGQLLDKMLAAISLSRTANCFITNIVKCRPPHNRDPLPDESTACRPYLKAQIALLKPAMILAVGRIAAQSLFDTSEGIGRLRGRIGASSGLPCMATYHPSALLRNEALKRPAWEDLQLFRDQLKKIDPNYGAAFEAEQRA